MFFFNKFLFSKLIMKASYLRFIDHTFCASLVLIIELNIRVYLKSNLKIGYTEVFQTEKKHTHESFRAFNIVVYFSWIMSRMPKIKHTENTSAFFRSLSIKSARKMPLQRWEISGENSITTNNGDVFCVCTNITYIHT